MSIVRVAFLFDYSSFGRKITPVLDSLKNGNFDELRNLANGVARDHPQVWKLLDDLAYFPSDLGSEEESFNTKDSWIAFWVTILICDFCLRLDNLVKTEPTPEVLHQLGVDKDIITTLIWGKPIGDLFLSLITLDENSNNYPFWNLGFKIGWLSIEDIEYIRSKIQIHNGNNSRPAYVSLLSMLDLAIQSKAGLILSAIP